MEWSFWRRAMQEPLPSGEMGDHRPKVRLSYLGRRLLSHSLDLSDGGYLGLSLRAFRFCGGNRQRLNPQKPLPSDEISTRHGLF
jgi:hypothetical protein